MDSRERRPSASNPLSTFNPRERHYEVPDLAAAWNLSADTIRSIFLNEPDVIVITNPRRGIRIFRTLRIPESVAQRVYERLKNKNRSPRNGGAR
jgi:hypothetical protein